MNSSHPVSENGHPLSDLPAGTAALLALGDAGPDGFPLRYFSPGAAPEFSASACASFLHPLAAAAAGDGHAMRYTPDDDDIEFEFAAESCPSPERCQRQGCRGLCHSPAA